MLKLFHVLSWLKPEYATLQHSTHTYLNNGNLHPRVQINKLWRQLQCHRRMEFFSRRSKLHRFLFLSIRRPQKNIKETLNTWHWELQNTLVVVANIDECNVCTRMQIIVFAWRHRKEEQVLKIVRISHALLWESVLSTLTYPYRNALRVVGVRLFDYGAIHSQIYRFFSETTQYPSCTGNVFHLECSYIV